MFDFRTINRDADIAIWNENGNRVTMPFTTRMKREFDNTQNIEATLSKWHAVATAAASGFREAEVDSLKLRIIAGGNR